ncbi:MAG TPA: immunoglobulin domain-containing protein [Verrucomicrobiae bacterium]|nr:immunoglobulin domain-containing protein [Verrucomicrobiae bacterium]
MAASQNVITDPNLAYYGYENVFTNGLTATTQPAYISQYLGSGGGGIGAAFPNDSSVDTLGNVTIGADDWPDVTTPYNTDTNIWTDATGTSAAICETLSDIYAENTSFSAGDSVTFTGSLATNTLASPYNGNAILFIKDYDSGWGFHGFVSLHINTLTNGQAFSLTMPSIFGNNDHIQYGLEWSGPPVRSGSAASYGMAMISTNGAVVAPPPPPKNVYVYLDPSQQWAGYRNVVDQFGQNYGPASGYIGVGGQTPDFQGTISSQGLVRCAPDISLDVYFQTDLNIWADASGTSSAVATYDNTFYVDSTGTGANGGDTVVFSGTLVTNALTDAGMSGSLVAFIKDFSASWAYYGEQTVALSSLTNGQTFNMTKVINGTGDHVQWGFEWQGVPTRTNASAANYVGQYGYVLFSSNSAVSSGPQILAITPSTANALLGSNVTFTANAIGNSLAYKWSKNGVNLVNGGGISGATSSTLNLNGVQPSQEGTYTLVVTDSSSLSATNTVSLVVYNPSWLYFDRALAPFNGYINVWNGGNLLTNPPASGAGGTTPPASFGFGVTPTSLVRATMNLSNDTITLQPNTYVYDGATNTMDPNYINPDGSAAAYMEQDYYIQNDSLAGDVITFSGYCPSNTLNAKYTARAWIKDGSPSWNVEHRYDAPLVAGQPFKVTVASTPGDHIQYGFGLWGPDNSSTNPITQGAVVVKVYSPISSVNRSGSHFDLSFPTVINHSYSVQYKTNLTDSTWTTLTTSNGTGINVTVTDTNAAASRRFYRLSTQ